jgi:AraC-like DNA-binding protein
MRRHAISSKRNHALFDSLYDFYRAHPSHRDKPDPQLTIADVAFEVGYSSQGLKQAIAAV